jgi:trigger factor
VGQAVGETRNLTLKLPEEYRDKELAGQDADFTVTVNWVKAKVLPALDDTFPSVVGTEFESLEALRAAIRENLSAREEHERRVAHEEQVVQAVVDQATVDLPPQLVEEEAGRIVQSLAQNLEAQGIPLQSYLRFTQKTEDEFRAEMMAQAERSVRRSEVLNAIALAEGVEITDDEMREQLTLSMEDTNENRRLIRDSLRRPQVRERVAASMRRERAIRMLLETVGGVDFAALEAEADTTQGAISEAAEDIDAVDPVDEAADEVKVAAAIEEIDEAVEKLSAMAATSAEPTSDVTAATTDEKPAQASGDTPA